MASPFQFSLAYVSPIFDGQQQMINGKTYREMTLLKLNQAKDLGRRLPFTIYHSPFTALTLQSFSVPASTRPGKDHQFEAPGLHALFLQRNGRYSNRE